MNIIERVEFEFIYFEVAAPLHNRIPGNPIRPFFFYNSVNCYLFCVLYNHNHNIDLRNSMNEQTHFLMKIYISHTLFSMFLWCVRGGWRQGQTSIWTQLLLLTIARCVIFKNPLSTSSASWLGLLNRGSLRATALILQAVSHCGLPVAN